MTTSPAPHIITLGHRFGDVVYLRCRNESVKGMVTAVVIRPSAKLYGVTWGDSGHESFHNAFELDTEFTPDLTAQ